MRFSRSYIAFLMPLLVAMAAVSWVPAPAMVMVVGLASGVGLAVWWSERDLPKANPKSSEQLLDRIEQYVNGKVHRYWLLFAVNGGASVVARYVLALEEDSSFGPLRMHHVAIGASLFTILMTWDLWLWGCRMRQPDFVGNEAFTPAGRAIALTIGGLLLAGWRLAM